MVCPEVLAMYLAYLILFLHPLSEPALTNLHVAFRTFVGI